MATVGEKMTAIADAIRTKTGGTGKLTLDAMASGLNNIPERTSSNLSASGATVTVPAGNYKTQATKSVSTVNRAGTTMSVTADDTNDKLTITASNNQGTGYVTGSNQTATKTISLTTSGANVTASDGTNSITKSVSTVSRANTTMSVTADDTNDKLTITASNNQGTGYVTGSNKTATKTITLTSSGANVTASDGTNSVTKSVSTVSRAGTTMSVSVDDTNDKLTITASNNQGTGYVTGSNQTATKTISLTTSGATITASDGTNKVSRSVATASRANTTMSVSVDDTNDKLIITASNNQGTGYVTGSNKTATKTITLTSSGATVTASDGTNKVSRSVATATQATPSISVNSAGLITASATQSAGYVSAGTKSATKQLTVQAAATITPGTSAKTAVAAGRYTTGAVTVAGDADLVAANIVSGKNIFGVAGSHNCANTLLNFKVVGGTSQPSNPSENTIWVNTSTSISGWSIVGSEYTFNSSINGYVYIICEIAEANDLTTFNALNSNGIWISPMAVLQRVSGSYVEKEAYIYINSEWISLEKYIYYYNKQSASWNSIGYALESSQTALAPTVTYASNGAAILTYSVTQSGTAMASGFFEMTSTIDLTDFSTIKFDGTCTRARDDGMLCHLLVYTTNRSSPIAGVSLYSGNTLDISSLSGDHTVTIRLIGNAWVSGNNTGTITIKRILLTR